MEKMETVVNRSTNPFLTLALFGAIIVGVVFTGSHFSQRNSAARELEAAMRDTVTAVSTVSP